MIKVECLLLSEVYCQTFQDSDTIGKWDWLLQFQPPLNSRTMYYLFSFCRQSLKVGEKGVDGKRAISQWHFTLWGTAVCAFIVRHLQRNTKDFCSFHLASKQSCTVLREASSNFLLQQDTRLQINSLSLLYPPPLPTLWHYSECFFPKGHD